MMKSEFSSLYRAIAIAVFLVFVVMAAQFESVKFSIMVMTTIPFSLVGSFGLLKLTGVSISMTSLLGFLWIPVPGGLPDQYASMLGFLMLVGTV